MVEDVDGAPVRIGERVKLVSASSDGSVNRLFPEELELVPEWARRRLSELRRSL